MARISLLNSSKYENVLLHQLLENAGDLSPLQVESSNSISDIMLQIQTQPPDLILFYDDNSTVKLEDNFSRLRDVIEKIPAIVILSEADDTIFTDYLQNGASNCFLLKEITAKRFIKSVHSCIERKKYELMKLHSLENLLQSQKRESLQNLASGVAHDFNNLLTAILGHIELIKVFVDSSHPAFHYLDSLEIAAQKGTDLSEKMLAFSGYGRYLMKGVNVEECVQEIAGDLETYTTKSIKLIFRHSGNLPKIEADYTQVQQVVINLVKNSAESIGDTSGTILVTTSFRQVERSEMENWIHDESVTEGSFICIEVSDSGQGMEASTIERMFDPFFTTKFVGRGLGLSAVLGIMQGHHGAVEVKSELGLGTVIRVYFPVTEMTETEKESLRAKKKSTNKECILIIDDEENIRNSLRTVLTNHGYKVLEAADGFQGMRLVKRYQDEIDIVLIDLTMPEISGIETLRRIRETKPDIKAVLGSGFNKEQAATQFWDLGFTGFTKKPYHPTDLLKELEFVLQEE